MPPIPPMPPMPGDGAALSSSRGFSATMASVVSISDATEAAFCSAQRETFAGSMTVSYTHLTLPTNREV